MFLSLRSRMSLNFSKNHSKTSYCYLRSIKLKKKLTPDELDVSIKDNPTDPTYEQHAFVNDVDFFGILRDEGVVSVELEESDHNVETVKETGVKLSEKFDKLLKYTRNLTEEKFYETNFGTLRFDTDNEPSVHGQFDENLKPKDLSNFMTEEDDCYSNLDSSKENKKLLLQTFTEKTNQVAYTNSELLDNHVKDDDQSLERVDDVSSHQHQLDECVANSNRCLRKQDDDSALHEDHKKVTRESSQTSVSAEQNITEIHQPITKHEQKQINYIPPDVENPKTAFDFVMKKRKEKKIGTDLESKITMDGGLPLDSKGFRIYKNQADDASRQEKHVILKILKNSILYNQNEILAIYKPYGLPVQGNDGNKSQMSLVKLLPELSKIITKNDESTLYTVHRIDRETTGVLLLAKTQYMAHMLSTLFKQKKVIKTYYGLTKGVPEPRKGLIDIPIMEGSIDGRARMVLRPHLDQETKLVMKKSSVKTHMAVTSYEVLHCTETAALVKFVPETGVKHQIRVHMGFGMGCPILGDHKYSHLKKLAPQKLPGEMLDRLKVRQAKVRHIPMHLHSKSIVIPEIIDGRNIFIAARLPPHFLKNMSRLKIKIP